MEEEIKLLAKWTAALWQTYKKYVQIRLTAADFEAVVTELRSIWEDSGENQLIMDMAAAFANDLDRRAAHAER